MEMNQELLGCNGGFFGDCKTSSFNGGIVNPLPSVLPRSPSSSSYSIKASHSEKQNLRCPRCESSNTKFCYYNNYNLTQPRHFCKTCRRYWTKGGALRNIPIGGGCRKNKTSVMPTVVGKSSSAKTKMFLSEIGGNVFHQQLALNSILCDSSHHLGFLRALQNPNQAAASAGDWSSPKNDATMIGGLEAMTAVVARSSRFDSLKKSSAMALSSSVWREGNQTLSSGSQECHQKLRFSSENIFADHPSIFLSNMPSSSAASMLISTPVAGGDLSRLNPAFSCSDLPATSGAYI